MRLGPCDCPRLPPWRRSPNAGRAAHRWRHQARADHALVGEAPHELQSGKYYRLDITADGTAELAIQGPQFFRNIWIREVLINDIEVRSLGLDSIESDAEGTATMSLVTIRPGRFTVRTPGTTGETQQATFNVK